MEATSDLLAAQQSLDAYRSDARPDPNRFGIIWDAINKNGPLVMTRANNLAVHALAMWPDLDDKLSDTLLSAQRRGGHRPENLERIAEVCQILAAKSRAHLLRQESRPVASRQYSSDEITHAEFGSTDLPKSWKDKTRSGENLADRIKYLFSQSRAVVVTPDELDMDDPGGSGKKLLRMWVSGGKRRNLAVGMLLKLEDAWEG